MATGLEGYRGAYIIHIVDIEGYRGAYSMHKADIEGHIAEHTSGI